MKIYSPTITGSAANTNVITVSQTGSLTALSASFASTASSADNLTVRGTLTAQTINVQTITSSIEFVTGSTRNGSIAANTHQFTGSVYFSGSVGYGTSSPSYRLSLVSTPSSAGFDGINVTTGTADVIGLYRTGASYSYGMVGANQSWIYSNYGDLNIVADASSANIKLGTSGGTARLFISASGNVGIGTNNPTYKLQVEGNTFLHGDISFGLYGETTYFRSVQVLNYLVIGGSENIDFQTYNNDAWGARMTIKKNGAVGIGTTTPGSTLQVNGGISSHSGVLSIADSTFTTVYTFAATDTTGGMFQCFIGGTNSSLVCLWTKSWNGAVAQLVVGGTVASNGLVSVQVSGNSIQVRQTYGVPLDCYWSVQRIF